MYHYGDVLQPWLTTAGHIASRPMATSFNLVLNSDGEQPPNLGYTRKRNGRRDRTRPVWGNFLALSLHLLDFASFPTNMQAKADVPPVYGQEMLTAYPVGGAAPPGQMSMMDFADAEGFTLKQKTSECCRCRSSHEPDRWLFAYPSELCHHRV